MLMEPTFLEVTPEIKNLPAHGGNKKVGNFLLRGIVAAHDKSELRLIGNDGRSKNGAGD